MDRAGRDRERAYPFLRSHIEGYCRETGLDLCSTETDRCGVLAALPRHITQMHKNVGLKGVHEATGISSEM